MAQAFQSNQGTQTNLLVDTTGGTSASGTSIPVMKISIDAAGTFTNGGIWNGSITGVGVIPNLPGGTLNLLTTVSNLSAGSVNVVAGTVNAGTINTGTINAGTINNGSIVVTAGTVSAGTINTGTINIGTVVGKDANAAVQMGNPLAIGGTDSGGTIRTIKVDSGGLQRIGIDSGTISVLPNLPQGSINVTAGTITTGTVNTGTVNTGTINTGTINAGTINNGSIVVTLGTVVGTVTTNQATGTLNLGTVRVDARTTQNILTYGTQVAFTGAAAATIIGSASVGAGTSMWVNDVSLFNMQSGAGTFILGFGTAQQGTNVLLRAPIGTSSAVGIEKTYAKAVNAGMTNQDLVLSATGAGTVDLSISYFISN